MNVVQSAVSTGTEGLLDKGRVHSYRGDMQVGEWKGRHNGGLVIGRRVALGTIYHGPSKTWHSPFYIMVGLFRQL